MSKNQNTKLSDEHYEFLLKLAKENMTSVSHYVRIAVKEWVERNK